MLALVFLAMIAACAPSGHSGHAPSVQTPATVQSYLQSASHLTAEQRLALSESRPFTGMTWEEANIAMAHVATLTAKDQIPLMAVFKGSTGANYVLYFDGSKPNRVIQWSLYTPREVEEIRKFPERYPWPPVSGTFGKS